MKEIQHIITHSSIREYENDGDDQDRYYLPWRASVESASRVKLGQKAWTILPRHEPFEEFLGLLEVELLGGQSLDRLYTSDSHYLMDEDIEYELMPTLYKISDANTAINPYQATDEFYKWASRLQRDRGVIISSDKKEKNSRDWWGQKGAYHRWVDNLSNPSLTERIGLSFPHGFIARNIDEAIKAYEMLGVKDVVLKPIFGAGGFRIEFCSNIFELKEYMWPEDPLDASEMPVAVQEKLNIEYDSQGQRVFSMQFKGKRILGQLTRQKMEGTEWAGNTVPAEVPKHFEEESMQQVNKLLQSVNPQGSGGVDIADVNGKPVILEVNGGRPTGAHIPKLFKRAFAPNSEFLTFEKVPVGRLTSHEVWDRLNSILTPGTNKKLGFDKDSQSGVFPIVWLQESWGMVASFADNSEDANRGIKLVKERII